MSINKLAQHLGISKSTVSRALNGYTDVNPDTREKVFAAAREMGYRPNATARRLASGKSRHVGILLPASSRMFVSPAFSMVLASAASFLAKHEYQLIVSTVAPFQDEMKVYRDFIDSGMVDGLFVVRTRNDDARIRYLDQSRFPYVCLGYCDGFSKEQFVDVDNHQAFYEMTRRQIAFGHKRIACILGPEELTLSQARKAGYETAMKEAGLPVNPGWVKCGELTEADAGRLASEIMCFADRPSAILCADDYMAIGTMSACEKLGFKPGSSISITGYGDYEMSQHSHTPLTTMSFGSTRVGESMAGLMLNKLEGRRFNIENWHEAQVVERDSDGAFLQ